MTDRAPRFGDRITALPDTVTAIFAEGREGVVVEARHEGGGRWAGSNLVVWGDDQIVMGFHPDNVEVVG